VAQTYCLLGIEHILTGIDHLLFVLALILLIRDRWMLVKTITAFTVAHSITLAGAALGYFSLPQAPVEATIALSIAFVARELARAQPGERRLSESYPWVIAFAFGLLHGFGFASTLSFTDQMSAQLLASLVSFNIGIELGQALIVAVAFPLLLAVRRLAFSAPAHAGAAVVAATFGLMWFFERLVA